MKLSNSKMLRIVTPLMALLPLSCGLSGKRNASERLTNLSALHDPVTVTCIPGKVYLFEEGTIAGMGQKLHSDYSYRRAIIIGNANQEL